MVKRPEKLPIAPPKASSVGLATIPMEHERIIGRLVVEWAKLEATLDDLIWNFLDVPLQYGQIITSRMDANNKLAMIRLLSETSFGHSSSDYMLHTYLMEIVDTINIVRESRNLIVHGTWGREFPDLVPMALSLRIKDTPSTIVSELFPAERIRVLTGLIVSLKWALVHLFNSANVSHCRSRELFREQSHIRRPNPAGETG